MSDGLSLEKLKIREDLNEVKTELSVLTKEIRLKNELAEKNIEKLNHIIIGNGMKGLSEKVRNLEENESKRTYYLNAVFIAIIGLACKSIWQWWTGKPH